MSGDALVTSVLTDLTYGTIYSSDTPIEITGGTVTFSKGIVFAYGTAATEVINGTYSGSTVDAILAAWNKAAGKTEKVACL